MIPVEIDCNQFMRLLIRSGGRGEEIGLKPSQSIPVGAVAMATARRACIKLLLFSSLLFHPPLPPSSSTLLFHPPLSPSPPFHFRNQSQLKMLLIVHVGELRGSGHVAPPRERRVCHAIVVPSATSWRRCKRVWIRPSPPPGCLPLSSLSTRAPR